LKQYTSQNITKSATNCTPALVDKSAWKYAGKILKITGTVSIAQDYAPGSDISNSFGGGEIGELVLLSDDGAFVDYLNLGSTGNIAVGDSVIVYGYAIGHVTVKNKLGGETRELSIMGKHAEGERQ
jgi:hypothetical protein